MNKHTPGKWIVQHASYGRNDCVIMDELYVARDGDNISIAAEISDPETGEFSMANARLIAAAPDLLEVLEQFVAWVDAPSESAFSDSQLAAARAAIAKAKGEQA